MEAPIFTPPYPTPPSSPDTPASFHARMITSFGTFDRGHNFNHPISDYDITGRAIACLRKTFLFDNCINYTPIDYIGREADLARSMSVFGDVSGKHLHVHTANEEGGHSCVKLTVSPTGNITCFCNHKSIGLCLHRKKTLNDLVEGGMFRFVHRTLSSFQDNQLKSPLNAQLLKYKFFHGSDATFDKHKAVVKDKEDGRCVEVQIRSIFFKCTDENCGEIDSVACEHVKTVALAASTMGIHSRSVENTLSVFRFEERIRFVEKESRFLVIPRRICFDLDSGSPVSVQFSTGIFECNNVNCQERHSMCDHILETMKYCLLHRVHQEIVEKTALFWEDKRTYHTDCSCETILTLEEYRSLFYSGNY